MPFALGEAKMKLVDILATELKAWPESLGAYCVASSHGSSGKTRYPVWFCVRKPYRGDGGWCDIGAVELTLDERPEDQKYAIVTRTQWQAAVDALKAAEQVWDGACLPPVGCVCEHSNLINGEPWTKVEVVAHRTFEGDVYPCAIFVYRKGSSHSMSGDHFRPIRTAEQIAAQEREKAIKEMMTFLGGDGDELINAFGRMYDAGWRRSHDA